MKPLFLLLLGFSAIAFADDTPTTYVESRPPGARIIVDGEYLGNAPLYIHLDFPHSIKIVKAIPANEGCVQVEALYQKLPKRMFFDTRMCQPSPSLDVYSH